MYQFLIVDGGGAPKGEHPRRADCVSGSARDARANDLALRAYDTGPPKGAAAPERLSALRSLTCV